MEEKKLQYKFNRKQKRKNIWQVNLTEIILKKIITRSLYISIKPNKIELTFTIIILELLKIK